MEHSIGGIAFAVTANEELVYTGYFVPSYSSASVQWIVIDPLFWHLTNRMYVNLGYPGLFEGAVIPDHRNDERILKIFAGMGTWWSNRENMLILYPYLPVLVMLSGTQREDVVCTVQILLGKCANLFLLNGVDGDDL